MKRSAAAAALGLTLAAAVAVPALATGHHADASRTFKSYASPNTKVTPGTTIVTTGHGAEKSASYDCVMIVLKGSTYGYDINTLKTVKSNKKGKVVCKQTFQPYTVTAGGKTRHCPTTKSDRKAGYSCAVALADAQTSGQTSASDAKFTAKK